MICIDWDRDVLYDRINRRVDIMIKSGLLEEVKCLMDMGYTQELNSMKGIGYKEVMDYYDGKMSLEDAVELIKQAHAVMPNVSLRGSDATIGYIM